MTAKEYLEQMPYLDHSIQYATTQMYHYDEYYKKTYMAGMKIPTRKENAERYKQFVDAFAEAREQEANRIAEDLQLKREIEAAVRSLPDPRLRAVLQMHFFEKKTYREIADELNYSEIYIRKLCKEGLEAIQVPE